MPESLVERVGVEPTTRRLEVDNPQAAALKEQGTPRSFPFGKAALPLSYRSTREQRLANKRGYGQWRNRQDSNLRNPNGFTSLAPRRNRRSATIPNASSELETVLHWRAWRESNPQRHVLETCSHPGGTQHPNKLEIQARAWFSASHTVFLKRIDTVWDTNFWRKARESNP